MQRRQFVSGAVGSVAVGSMAGLAGCSVRLPLTGPDAPPPTAEDAAPKEYLPAETDPWRRTDTNAVAATEAGAEAGVAATYTRPGATAEYNVEIMRWPDAGSADGTASNYYGGWKAFVVRENWSFAARGPDRARVAELLGHSPVLTTEWVEYHDRGRG